MYETMKQDFKWWHVIALVVIIAGIILTIWSAQQQDQFMRNDLLSKTSIAETGVSFEQVSSLRGSAADIASPDYQTLKTQLKKIRAADPDIRFAYLIGQRQDGTIILYADSESPESADYSPPGQVYTEAPAVLTSLFKTGEMASEGPYTDRWGTWVSGFIPVTDPMTGKVIAIFGVDIDAKNWNSAIAQSCTATIAATLLILVLVIAFGLSQQRSIREQHRIAASEKKFFRVFHENPTPMAVSTIEEGRFLDVNTSFLTALGYSREEVIGRTAADLNLYSDPALRDVIISQFKETGQVHAVDVNIIKKNQGIMVGSFSAIPIEIDGLSYLLTIIIDITERKRAEDVLQRMNTKITTLNSITRHNLINTLTGLLGMIAMAQDPSSRPELDNILLTIKNLTENIQEQIEFSRDYQAAGMGEPRWQSVRETVSSAARPFTNPGISILNEISGCEVYADPLLEKAFSHLVINAIRNGGPLTTITFTENLSDTGLSIVCEYNCAGIPADSKEKIFDQSIGQFSNMELFLTREILSITGITITENGEPGKGARFEMMVPEGVWRAADVGGNANGH
jgi:PAS domain S-box-containing protein